MRVLAVGVSETSDGKFHLPRAQDDVEAFSQALSDAAGQPEDELLLPLLNPTKDQFTEALQTVATKGEGLLVLYFSGHAVQESSTGSASLICFDSNPHVPTTLLAGELIGEILNQATGSSLLLVLDCCYAEDVASQISRKLSWKISGSVILSACMSRTQAVQPACLAQISEGYASNLSAFTRSLVLGLRGICQEDPSIPISPARLSELAYYEAARLHGSRPTLTQVGIARHLSVKKRSPGEAQFSLTQRGFLSGFGKAAENTTPETIALHGSEGAYALAYASAQVRSARDRLLNGVGPASLTLSGLASRADSGTVILESARSPQAIQQAKSQNRVGLVGLVGASPRPDVSDNFSISLELPALTPELLITFSQFSPWRDLVSAGETRLEALAEFAGDSLEAASVGSKAALLSPDRGLRASDVEQLVKEYLAEIANDRVLTLLAGLLAAAPSVPLASELVEGYLNVEFSLPLKDVQHGLTRLIGMGILSSHRRYVRMTSRVRDEIGSDVKADGVKFLDGMFRAALDRQEARFRLDTLRALCASVEEVLFAGALRPAQVDAVERVGPDWTYWLGPSASDGFLRRVIDSAGNSTRTRLWLQRGDALRLMDDYQGSLHAFTSAQEFAQTESEKAEAQIGIVSAAKNSASTVPQLAGLTHGLAPASTVHHLAPVPAARSFFQAGNMEFSQSNWDTAARHYLTAESLLDAGLARHSSLLFDVWKGLGDVLLHQGDHVSAGALATKSLDLVAKHDLVSVDVRAHAKACQFVGDVLRNAGAYADPSSTDAALLDAAKWWYELSAQVFRRYASPLGVCMSEFRRAQCLFAQGKLGDALAAFLALREDFTQMNNPLWLRKTSIMILLISRRDVARVPKLVVAEAQETVEAWAANRDLSRYQLVWYLLATRDESSISEAVAILRETGAKKMADSLETQGISGQIGGDY